MPATSDGLQCECDPTRFFIWNAAQLKCVCLSGHFLRNEECSPCAALPGYNPAAPATLNSCTCNTSGLFQWSLTLFQCVCQVSNYFEEGSCKPCRNLAGAAANGSSLDGKCFCNTAKYFEWSVTANKCVCNGSSYITAAAACNTCANLSADGQDGVTCSCPDGKEWGEYKCLCSVGTFLDLSLPSPKCSECAGNIGVLPQSTPIVAGRCICDTEAGYVWSAVASKCVCGNSTFYDA